MRASVGLLLAVVVLWSSAAVAGGQAPKLLRGQTGQGETVAMRVGADGRVARVTLGWRASCRRGRVRDRVVVRPPRRRTTTDVFAVTGSYRVRQGGLRLRVRMTVRGLRDASTSDRWTGTLRGTVRITRRGRPFDRCRLRSTVWSATLPAAAPPPAASPAPDTGAPAPPSSGTSTSTTGEPPAPTPGPWKLDMTGDAGDYITGGRTWVHGPPSDRIRASGGRSLVTFSIDTADGGWWTVEFAAPPGQQFAPGTRWNGARRYPFNDGSPGLNVSGMGRGCNTLTGDFTVHEIAFDERGVLRRFQATFEQHCEGGTAAARGTMDFTAA